MSKLLKIETDNIILAQLQLELERVFSLRRCQIYNVIDCYLEQFKDDTIYWVYLVYIKLLVKSTEEINTIDLSNDNIFIPPEDRVIPYANEQELTVRMWLPDFINSWIINEKLKNFRTREVYKLKLTDELLCYLPNKLANLARRKSIKIRKTITDDVVVIDAKLILDAWTTKYLENDLPTHFDKEIKYQEQVKLCVEVAINTSNPNLGQSSDIKHTYFDQVDEHTRVSVEMCNKGYVFVIEIEKDTLSKENAKLYMLNALAKYLPNKSFFSYKQMEFIGEYKNLLDHFKGTINTMTHFLNDTLSGLMIELDKYPTKNSTDTVYKDSIYNYIKLKQALHISHYNLYRERYRVYFQLYNYITSRDLYADNTSLFKLNTMNNYMIEMQRLIYEINTLRKQELSLIVDEIKSMLKQLNSKTKKSYNELNTEPVLVDIYAEVQKLISEVKLLQTKSLSTVNNDVNILNLKSLSADLDRLTKENYDFYGELLEKLQQDGTKVDVLNLNRQLDNINSSLEYTNKQNELLQTKLNGLSKQIAEIKKSDILQKLTEKIETDYNTLMESFKPIFQEYINVMNETVKITASTMQLQDAYKYLLENQYTIKLATGNKVDELLETHLDLLAHKINSKIHDEVNEKLSSNFEIMTAILNEKLIKIGDQHLENYRLITEATANNANELRLVQGLYKDLVSKLNMNNISAEKINEITKLVNSINNNMQGRINSTALHEAQSLINRFAELERKLASHITSIETEFVEFSMDAKQHLKNDMVAHSVAVNKVINSIAVEMKRLTDDVTIFIEEKSSELQKINREVLATINDKQPTQAFQDIITELKQFDENLITKLNTFHEMQDWTNLRETLIDVIDMYGTNLNLHVKDSHFTRSKDMKTVPKLFLQKYNKHQDFGIWLKNRNW